LTAEPNSIPFGTSIKKGRFAEIVRLLQENMTLQIALLVGMTLFGAALRFYKLGEWSFWIDEIFTINHASAHYSDMVKILNNIPPVRNWVPVSVILTAQVLNVFGVNEWSARLASAGIGIMSIPILYFPLKKLFGNQVTWIALLLLAINPWHIEWSQNARFYTSLLLFYMLALLIYFYAIEKDRPVYIFVFIIFFYMGVSERLVAVFIFPVILGYLLLLKILPFDKPPGLRLRNVLLTLLPVMGGISIEIYSFISEGVSRFMGGFNWFLLYRIGDPLRMLSFISFDIGIPIMVFSFFCGIYLLVKKSRAGLLLFISAVVPVFLLIVLNPFIFTLTRYVFITLPSWIILASFGIKELITETKGQGKLLAFGLLFLFVADFGGSNLLYFHVNNGNRLDWREAFSTVRERGQEGDEVVTWWPDWKGVYWDREIIKWENLEPEFIISSGKRFWFILDNETIWGNHKMKVWIERRAELINIIYLRREDDAHLKIYLYDPAKDRFSEGYSEIVFHNKPKLLPFTNSLYSSRYQFPNTDSK
jgi:mannosyltransferase